MPPSDDQVNDPKTCPNVDCRSTSFDIYDEDGGPPGDYIIAKCVCEECGWTWQDEYKIEFAKREEVEKNDG